VEDEGRMDEYNRLLIVLTIHLLRGPRQPLDGTVEQIEAVLHRLRIRYVVADTPYGDDEQGFQRWLLDCWPAPSMA
jgi:hypothetical protein